MYQCTMGKHWGNGDDRSRGSCEVRAERVWEKGIRWKKHYKVNLAKLIGLLCCAFQVSTTTFVEKAISYTKSKASYNLS